MSGSRSFISLSEFARRPSHCIRGSKVLPRSSPFAARKIAIRKTPSALNCLNRMVEMLPNPHPPRQAQSRLQLMLQLFNRTDTNALTLAPFEQMPCHLFRRVGWLLLSLLSLCALYQAQQPGLERELETLAAAYRRMRPHSTRQDFLPSVSETRRVLRQHWDFSCSVIETSKTADSRKQRNL